MEREIMSKLFEPISFGNVTVKNRLAVAPMGTIHDPDGGVSPEQRAYLDSIDGVALGSDAFFPFADNIKRAVASGVKYIAQPGGSIRDDLVIAECDKNGIAMAFTGMRLFHH